MDSLAYACRGPKTPRPRRKSARYQAPTTGREGGIVIEGLPPGPYRVQMTPIEGSINADNFGGIFSEFATDFTPEFYDNSRVENTAQTIEVQAGQTVREIDFTTGFIRPGFPSVELSGLAANTPDTTGPYTVRVQAINTDQLWLHYRSSLALSDRIPMRSAGKTCLRPISQANPYLHKLSIALRRATTPLTKSFTQKTSVGSALTSSNSAVPPWPLLRCADRTLSA